MKLVSVVGARPQFVKLAPIVRALKKNGTVDHRIVHTGQHYDDRMSAVFFDELQLPRPDIDLGVGSGTHGAQTAGMLTRIEEFLLAAHPRAVIVYGDTNSTLAATLAAVKLTIPTVHVESGLRSYDRSMPEEVNRLVADHCSDRLYAPTPVAVRNLGDEGLEDRTVMSGDVMLDAISHNKDLAKAKSRALDDFDLEGKSFGLVTVHRPVNTTEPALAELMSGLARAADECLPLLFPVHPRTRAVLDRLGWQSSDKLRIVEPLPYLDIISLVESAAIVITDSGGVQKEAAFLHTPCITMRTETEWTETVEIGVNRLLGRQPDKIAEEISNILGCPDIFDESVKQQLEAHYGQGRAAEIIVEDLVPWLAATTEPDANAAQ